MKQIQVQFLDGVVKGKGHFKERSKIGVYSSLSDARDSKRVAQLNGWTRVIIKRRK